MAFEGSIREQARNNPWSQSNSVIVSPQQTKYKYKGIRSLLTMKGLLARFPRYLMTRYTVAMVIRVLLHPWISFGTSLAIN